MVKTSTSLYRPNLISAPANPYSPCRKNRYVVKLPCLPNPALSSPVQNISGVASCHGGYPSNWMLEPKMNRISGSSTFWSRISLLLFRAPLLGSISIPPALGSLALAIELSSSEARSMVFSILLICAMSISSGNIFPCLTELTKTLQISVRLSRPSSAEISSRLKSAGPHLSIVFDWPASDARTLKLCQWAPWWCRSLVATSR